MPELHLIFRNEELTIMLAVGAAVDGALEFLAIADAREIVMKCVRFHDNKHAVISSACQALGSLVMNGAHIFRSSNVEMAM